MRYAGTRRSEHNPLRSLPLYRSLDVLRPILSVSSPVLPANFSPWPAPSASEMQHRELDSAEALLREAVRVLNAVRVMVEDAKRKTTPVVIVNGRLVGGGILLTPVRVAQRKAQARRLLAKRLAGMGCVARGWVEAARAALGLPSLIELEERAAKAAADKAARVAFKALGALSPQPN